MSFSGRGQAGSTAVLVVFIVAYVVFWRLDLLPGWLAGVGVAVFGVFVGVGVVAAIRSVRQGVVFQLDHDGVTIEGSDRVPWTDIDEVVISPLRPAWLVGSRLTQVVAFIPRQGVLLPGLPGSRPSSRPRRRAQSATVPFRRRVYGTDLIMMPSTMDASVDEIATAAERLGGVPTRRIPTHPVRRWLILIGVAVVAGLVVGVIVGLVRGMS